MRSLPWPRIAAHLSLDRDLADATIEYRQRAVRYMQKHGMDWKRFLAHPGRAETLGKAWLAAQLPRGGRNSLARYEAVLNDVAGWMAQHDKRWRAVTFPYTKPEYGHPDPLSPKQVESLRFVQFRYGFAQKRRLSLEFLVENTGLRRVEYHRMHLEHFNREESVVRLRRPGKHGKVRSVPLPRSTWDESGPFMDWIRERAKVANPTAGPLWVSRFGQPMSLNTMGGELAAIGRAAGVKVSFNRMRRTRATDLIERGVRIETLQELYGHASINSTRWYFEMTPELVRRNLQAANVPGFGAD